jgi:hypothetical protein
MKRRESPLIDGEEGVFEKGSSPHGKHQTDLQMH